MIDAILFISIQNFHLCEHLLVQLVLSVLFKFIKKHIFSELVNDPHKRWFIGNGLNIKYTMQLFLEINISNDTLNNNFNIVIIDFKTHFHSITLRHIFIDKTENSNTHTYI